MNLITKLCVIFGTLLIITANYQLMTVKSHTWFNCVKLADPNDRNSACLGYPRGYIGWTPGFVMENHYMNKVLNHDLNAPACAKAQSNKFFYNSNFPRAKVMAGETVSATYNSNGHVNFDKPLTNSTHAFYWTGNPNQQISRMGELTPENRLSSLQNYDDCVCGEAGYGPGVWFPKRGINGQNVVCQAFFTIPPNTPSGIYQIVWRWTYDKHFDTAADNKEEYTQCFDVIVTGPDCETPQDLPYAFTTTDVTNPDVNGPTYPSYSTDNENGFTVSGTPNYPKTVGTDIYPVGYVGTQAQAYGLKQAFFPNQQELCWDKSNGLVPYTPEGKADNKPLSCSNGAAISNFQTTSTTTDTTQQSNDNNSIQNASQESGSNSLQQYSSQDQSSTATIDNNHNQQGNSNNLNTSNIDQASTASYNGINGTNQEPNDHNNNSNNNENNDTNTSQFVQQSSTGNFNTQSNDSSQSSNNGSSDESKQGRFGFDAINTAAQYIPQTFDTPPIQESSQAVNSDPYAGMLHPQCSIFEPAIQEPLSKLDSNMAPTVQDLPDCNVQDLGSNVWITNRPDYSITQCNTTSQIGIDKVSAFALPIAAGIASDSNFSILIQYNASDFRAIVADLCLDDLQQCFAVGHQSVAPGQGILNLTLEYFQQAPVSENLALSVWMTSQSAIMGADRPQKLRFDWNLYHFKTIDGYSMIQNDCINVTSSTLSNHTFAVARQFPIQVASNSPITMHIQYVARNDSIVELALCDSLNLAQCVGVSQKRVNQTVGSVVDLDLNIAQCLSNVTYFWSLRTVDAFNNLNVLDWKLYRAKCGSSVEDLITADCPLVGRQERCSDDLFIAKKLLEEIEPPPPQPKVIVPQVVVPDFPSSGYVQIVTDQTNQNNYTSNQSPSANLANFSLAEISNNDYENLTGTDYGSSSPIQKVAQSSTAENAYSENFTFYYNNNITSDSGSPLPVDVPLDTAVTKSSNASQSGQTSPSKQASTPVDSNVQVFTVTPQQLSSSKDAASQVTSQPATSSSSPQTTTGSSSPQMTTGSTTGSSSPQMTTGSTTGSSSQFIVTSSRQILSQSSPTATSFALANTALVDIGDTSSGVAEYSGSSSQQSAEVNIQSQSSSTAVSPRSVSTSAIVSVTSASQQKDDKEILSSSQTQQFVSSSVVRDHESQTTSSNSELVLTSGSRSLLSLSKRYKNIRTKMN